MRELDRVREVYAERDRRRGLAARYDPLDPANLLLVQERERAVAVLLRCYGLVPLGEKRVLEVGCGTGGELRRFVGYGARPCNLHGIDLLPGYVESGKETSPTLHLVCGSADNLPYPDAWFDLVMQFTMFTSILDDAVRRRAAEEMLRVLKPSGVILWYDFWVNPINPDVRAIGLREIRALFPGCRLDARRVTLAPPLARRLARRLWWACELLGALPCLRTHYLVAIAKNDA